MDEKLSLFGDLIIKCVRDNSLFVLEGVISGHMKSQIDTEMHEKITKMTKEDVEILRDMAYRMVDLTIHNVLFMFEDSPSWKISNEQEMITSLSELSDGLAGELYTSDGWISKFSNYPPSKII